MRVALLGLFLLLLTACASSPEGDRTSENRNVITREQIAESGAAFLYDVVERLHPEWLTQPQHTWQFLVLDDDLEVLERGSDYLRRIGTAGVYELEYLNKIQATNVVRDMMSGVEKAIIIRTRPRGGE